jgi:hypothetical protein
VERAHESMECYKKHPYDNQVSRLQRSVCYQLKEWTNDHWRNKLECLEGENQCLWRMTTPEMRFPPPNFFPYCSHSQRNRSTKLRKGRRPGRPFDAQFQPLNGPSEPAFMTIVNKPMRAHALFLQLYPNRPPSLKTKTPSGRQGQPEQHINHVDKRAALEHDILC